MDWIGQTFTSDTGWHHLETLVDVDTRMAGSAGERRAAEATRAALADVGARNARIEPFDIQGWTRNTSRLVAGDTTQPCLALPRSPSAEVTAPLRTVEHGLPSDFEDTDIDGAVVLCRTDEPDWFDRRMHRREKYRRAIDGGAVAFVFQNHVPGCLPPTGSVGSEELPIGPIPAVGVSREVGMRLGRRFEDEVVTVDVEAESHDATSRNVHGELGPETEERVLLTSHVDAHDISEGAVDNGAGTAMVVQVAEALAARQADPDAPDLPLRVEFVAFGAEEVGLRGSEWYASRVDPETVRAVVNLDGVCRERTLGMRGHGFEEFGEAARAVSDRFDHPIRHSPRHMPHSDHWPFVARGMPGCLVFGDAETAGRGWGHTHADTLDKLEPRDLREGAILLAAFVAAVADREVEGRDPAEIAAALEAEGKAEAMRVSGDWPFDS